MTNAQLGEFVAELADLMALDGAEGRRVSHYRRAATVIRRFHHSLAELIEAGPPWISCAAARWRRSGTKWSAARGHAAQAASPPRGARRHHR